jgi:hypothetical protein
MRVGVMRLAVHMAMVCGVMIRITVKFLTANGAGVCLWHLSFLESLAVVPFRWDFESAMALPARKVWVASPRGHGEQLAPNSDSAFLA